MRLWLFLSVFAVLWLWLFLSAFAVLAVVVVLSALQSGMAGLFYLSLQFYGCGFLNPYTNCAARN